MGSEMCIRDRSADKVFLSADGVVAGRGLCEASTEQAYLKELMIQQAAEVFVLADSTKLGRDRQQHWTPLKTDWTLITDATATDVLNPFRQQALVRVETIS